MAWNEPGGSGDKNPWGQRSGGNQEPPDLDEVIRKLQQKFAGLFGGGSGSKSGGDGGGLSFGGMGLAAGVAFVIWLLSGFYIIEEGYRGVVLQLGSYHETTSPGLRWYPRFIQTVEKVDVSGVRSAKLGYQSEEALMLTQDENMIDIRFDVQYRIKDDPMAARDYLYSIRDPDETLIQATASAVREVIGKSKMDFVITEGRGVVTLEAQQMLQDTLDLYKTGLVVSQLTMQGAQAPTQVKAAFDDVVEAREDSVRFENEAETYANDVLPKARGQAARIIEESKAYQQETIAHAEGRAQRFVQVLEEYEKAPAVTKKRLYIDTMESVLSNSGKVLVDVKGGNNLLYLPLDRLGANRTGSTPQEAMETLQRINATQGSGRSNAGVPLRDNLRSREVR